MKAYSSCVCIHACQLRGESAQGWTSTSARACTLGKDLAQTLDASYFSPEQRVRLLFTRCPKPLPQLLFTAESPRTRLTLVFWQTWICALTEITANSSKETAAFIAPGLVQTLRRLSGSAAVS
jgi:hypothetical protein